ncbi:MAG: low molecular weight phosphotyrosine protein phosphatase [Kurthia sp.]|nr:low molecular weight phosphotyrosine protein phosphatase [Candidatus Kurthia equi]
MHHVLFVCLGNICRSPMAEAIFRNLVKQRGWENQFIIDSAGTSGWHEGEAPHKGTVAELASHHISTKGMMSRPLQAKDGEVFEYIVCMDNSNIKHAQEILGGPSDKQLIRLLDLTAKKIDVPDPYYTGDFKETYALCTLGCEALFNQIIKEQQ